MAGSGATATARLRRGCVPVILAALVLLAPGARAADVPTPVLLTSAARQEGATVWMTSSWPQGRYCVTLHADGPGEYPPAVAHDATRRLALRLARPDRPAEVRPRLWRVGVGRITPGPGETPAFTLAPVRSGSRVVAWDVLFDPPGIGDLHLDVVVVWPRQACGADDGAWRFHVRSL